jgi:2-keto-4-pentenoate hydratase
MTSQAPALDLLTRCAAELYEAEAARRPIDPLTDAHPGLSLADAYRIQKLNVSRRESAGQRIVGHKIGLTARAMQELFHVDQPDYGHLLDTMLLEPGAPLDLGTLIDPQIEVEPAFVLGRRLAGPGITAADVVAATDYICACFEIIDSRIIGWRIRLQDTVADNGSSARVALGTLRLRPGALALDDIDTELEVDGAVMERGNTRAVLGHPANGIAWLANTVAAYGITLEPGHVVLPGTPTRSVRIGGRRCVRGRMSGLGNVELELRGAPAVAPPN